MLYIGIDVGGTSVKAGVVDEKGNILHKASCLTLVERGHEAVIHDMAQLAIRVVEESGHTMDEIHSIGIGIPGMHDNRTKRVPFCTNLAWHDVPLIELMQKEIDKPIYVNNDATVAGLAESVAGISAGTKSSVFVTLGTGVGGGIIINGRPYSGAHGVGSEIGHMNIAMGGELCTCGNRGCFERYASATSIIRDARRAVAENPDSAIMEKCGGDVEKINAKIVIDAAKEGDAVAKQVFDGYVNGLAHGLVNLINVIDPEVIVLGGGVSMAGEFLLNAVREAMKPLIFFKSMPYADVKLATLGADAGIIGAAMLGKQ